MSYSFSRPLTLTNDAVTRQCNIGAPGRTRTVTLAHWLLRPACLPISPPGRCITYHLLVAQFTILDCLMLIVYDN